MLAREDGRARVFVVQPEANAEDRKDTADAAKSQQTIVPLREQRARGTLGFRRFGDGGSEHWYSRDRRWLGGSSLRDLRERTRKLCLLRCGLRCCGGSGCGD